MFAKKWILAKHFEGKPNEDDLQLVDDTLPELKENEALFKAVYLTVDPYMRPFTSELPEGSTMIGEQLAQVIESKNSLIIVGSFYLSKAGWRTHFISNGNDIEPIPFDIGNIPLSYTLGTLGMPGATAYFGLYKLCEPKSGEIVLVNGAAGAVGHLVGQLAKIRGCTVIAFAGSDEKVDWCKTELGMDHVFNYKKVNLSDAISSVAPQGVDVFFDNVGGEFFHTIVRKHMKQHGRIALSGSIQNYNDTEDKSYPAINFACVRNELKIQGFLAWSFKKDWPKAFEEMNQYIKEGKLKTKETLYDGFEKLRNAFYGLFTGENIGKAIVKV